MLYSPQLQEEPPAPRCQGVSPHLQPRNHAAQQRSKFPGLAAKSASAQTNAALSTSLALMTQDAGGVGMVSCRGVQQDRGRGQPPSQLPAEPPVAEMGRGSTRIHYHLSLPSVAIQLPIVYGVFLQKWGGFYRSYFTPDL